MKYTLTLFGICATMIASLLSPSIAFADTNASCSVLPAALCSTDDSTSTDVSKSSIFQIIVWVARILTGAVGIAAIGALVYAGILYSSAGNENAQVAKAKTIIKDTAIGLIAYGFMFILLNWLIPGGLFG